jgi:hypothetical protein
LPVVASTNGRRDGMSGTGVGRTMWHPSSTWSKIESGKAKVSPSVLAQIADMLGCEEKLPRCRPTGVIMPCSTSTESASITAEPSKIWAPRITNVSGGDTGADRAGVAL